MRDGHQAKEGLLWKRRVRVQGETERGGGERGEGGEGKKGLGGVLRVETVKGGGVERGECRGRPSGGHSCESLVNGKQEEGWGVGVGVEWEPNAPGY